MTELKPTVWFILITLIILILFIVVMLRHKQKMKVQLLSFDNKSFYDGKLFFKLKITNTSLSTYLINGAHLIFTDERFNNIKFRSTPPEIIKPYLTLKIDYTSEMLDDILPSHLKSLPYPPSPKSVTLFMTKEIKDRSKRYNTRKVITRKLH